MRRPYVLAASLFISAMPAFAQEKAPADRKSGEVEIRLILSSTIVQMGRKPCETAF